MYCKVKSGTIDGIDGVIIDVEADVSDGLPMFDMVGLLASEVRESKERVRIAIKNSGFLLPPKRITINLSPADVKKSGTGFDLAIATAIISGLGILDEDSLTDTLILGELGLDGSVKKINGVLSVVYEAANRGIRRVIVPSESTYEAALVEGVRVIGVSSLKETVEYLQGKIIKEAEFVDVKSVFSKRSNTGNLDFQDVAGQELVKRAIEIAVAGMHNILIIGPPGAGKTMLAQRIPGIMPALSFEESVRITKIYSVAGLLDSNEKIKIERPFRAPHHTITIAALTGGGSLPVPGEISLASKGVLFLDELPEFNKDTLEILRQPLEERYVCISRLSGNYKFDADFILVCAMNPCKCGHFPDRTRCRCTQSDIHRYLGKISRPILDRIDIFVEAQSMDYVKLNNSNRGDSSEQIRQRIERVREIQKNRFKQSGLLYNSQMREKEIKKYCNLDDDAKKLLENAFEVYSLTARGYHRIIKVARTIADFENSEFIKDVHVGEALCYRNADTKYWG